MGTEYRPSREDGLLARVSGEWAREKLHYVERYMDIFSQGMKYHWPNRIYIDLLAGPGRCVDRDTEEEFDGSPILALQQSFTKVILVEREAELAAALRSRAKGRAIVYAEDCNNTSLINEVRKELSVDTLALVFVDNLGLDVPFATLEGITRDRRVDLIITFQVQALSRNVDDVWSGVDSPERWTAFFGSDGWQKVVESGRARNESDSDIATGLMDFYGAQLGRIGYKYRTHSNQFMRNSRNVALYRLLLAGKHERAVEFFEKIAQIEYQGQRRLGF
jgi:three-Cys-motif partner protein